MGGLQSIIEEIKSEALAEAEGIRAAAQAEAEKCLAQAEADAALEVKQIEEQTRRRLEAVKAASTSAAERQHKQSLLEARQGLLADTLQKARDSLHALPVAEYFALCGRLALAAAEPGEGTMSFCAEDLARLPANFEAELASALPSGKAIRVAAQPCDIGGGFILQYGSVEQNCSFSAIFNARQEEFIDRILPVLFPE